MIPRRLCQLGPQQGKRWLISLVLGSLLLGGLLREVPQTQSLHAMGQSTLEVETQLLGVDDKRRVALTLRNPDRWEGREVTQELRLLRQCVDAKQGLPACLTKMLNTWREAPQLLDGFLEALRYQQRQRGREGDPGQIVELLQKMLPEARERMDAYSIWFQVHRRGGEGISQRTMRTVHQLQPHYLSLMLQAEFAARQGLRTASLAAYEAAVGLFLAAMLEKMRKNESITVEAYNQSHDHKDLARLYLQLGWWAEAEKVLYRLAEQEPADQMILSLMEQLRRRSTRTQAG